MIKRKNTINSQVDPEENLGVVELYRNHSKNMPRDKKEKIISHLMKSLNDTNENYKLLEKKVEIVSKQNETRYKCNKYYKKIIVKSNSY